jgi:hypothetical protein
MPARLERRYLDRTNVLETRFHTASALLVVTDFMPAISEEEKRRLLLPEHELIRLVTCERGDCAVEIRFAPRHDYGRRELRFQDAGPLGIRAEDAARFPAIAAIARALGGGASVTSIPIPRDCVDGFLGAFWARPEAYLDPIVRAGMSTLAAVGEDALAPGLARLAADLESGAWDARYGQLRLRTECDLGYRLVVARR